MGPAQSCEFDFKTSVYTNTLVFKNYSSKLSGPIKSKKFFGTSAHSAQTVSWHYVVQLGSTSTTFSVIVDSTSAFEPQLHGEISANFNQKYVTNIVTSGIIKSGSQIGQEMRVDRSSVLNYLLQDGTFTLTLTMSIHELVQEDVTPPQSIQPVGPLPDSQLLDHFAELLESEKFVDVTIIVRKTEFLAHKAILAARSPIFAAMFEHDMQESKQNRVTIEDVKPRVFQETLRFIYTGIVKELDQLANELLAVADKYALEKLKALCEDHLGTALTVETVTTTLYLADLHHAKQLKLQAVQFISRNIKAIPAADWQAIIATNPALAAQMFAEVARLN